MRELTINTLSKKPHSQILKFTYLYFQILNTMANANHELKNVFAQKFNEFQLNGLQSYGRYLKQQQKLAKTHENWESYGKYIENEIKRNDKKIAALNEKMA
jgi:hypothetical protein